MVPIEIACHSDGIRKCRIGFKVLNATSWVYFSFLQSEKLEYTPSFPYVVKMFGCVIACVDTYVYIYLFFKIKYWIFKYLVTSKKDDQVNSVEFFFFLNNWIYFFVFQTTHHVYEALWQCGDTNYTDIQDRPVPPAPYSHGQTHVQRSSKCYSR